MKYISVICIVLSMQLIVGCENEPEPEVIERIVEVEKEVIVEVEVEKEVIVEVEPATTTVKIVNNTGFTIWYLYFEESSSSSWGVEYIGTGNYLYSGQTYTLTDVPCGKKYDMKVEGFLWSLISVRRDEFLSCDSTYIWTIQ